jgi:hypothetical protein
MSKEQHYLPIPQPGHDSPSKTISPKTISPPCQAYILLAPFAPATLFNPNRWRYTFQPQLGKEFALGGAPQETEMAEIHPIWQDSQVSDPSMAKPTRHGTLCMTQGMTK